MRLSVATVRRLLLGMAACCLPVLGLAAESQSAASVRGDLIERLEAQNMLAADFVQTQTDEHGDVIERLRGWVRMRRPHFRWEITDPWRQTIIADGEQVQIYDPDLAQVTVRPLDESLQETPLALLSAARETLDTHYRVTSLGADAFRLDPHSDTAAIAALVLAFDGGRLARIVLSDPANRETDIRFSGFADASVIQSSDFELVLGPDVDVQ